MSQMSNASALASTRLRNLMNNTSFFLDGLRAVVTDNGEQPFFFGLGFIKLKLGPRYDHGSLHFYNTFLSENKTISDEEWHDHRYDFHSDILRGVIIQEECCFNEGPLPLYDCFEVSCQKGIPLPSRPASSGNISCINRQRLVAGSSYELSSGTFHKISTNEPTITFFQPGPQLKAVSRVLTPFGISLGVCPYESQFSSDDCWDIIKRCLEASN